MYNKLARHHTTVTPRHRVFLLPSNTSSPVSSFAAIDARGDLPTSTKLSSHPARERQKFIPGPTSPSHIATLAAADSTSHGATPTAPASHSCPCGTASHRPHGHTLARCTLNSGSPQYVSPMVNPQMPEQPERRSEDRQLLQKLSQWIA